MSDILNWGLAPRLSATGHYLACPDCNGTGLRDSGGAHPWGEAIFVPCDCDRQVVRFMQQAAAHREARRNRDQEGLSAEPTAEEVRFSKAADQQGNYTPSEWRAFNAGRAFAERIARAEQNVRSLIIARLALDGLVEYSSHATAHQIVKFLYPDLADLADQDPALARRALNALQPG